MPASARAGRNNQQQRTRKDLLLAAARLLKHGGQPTMDEIAEEALVSRATAYRYFPSAEALLLEAPLDTAVPTAHELFASDSSADPEERTDRAEAALHDMIYANESQLRLILSRAIVAGADAASESGTLVRQNRRTELIEAALAPARCRFTKANYDKLAAALALIFGPESMVVFEDVLHLDEKTARKVKSWALRALVRAALAESQTSARLKS